MKKFILLAAVLFSVTTIVKAEGTLGNNDNVKVNVKLNPIQTLFVNPDQKNIDLEYSTVGHYSEGVEATMNDHLTVYSTGAFVVKVNSDVDNIKRQKGDQTILASTIKVTAKDGDTNKLDEASYNSVSLSTTETNLISSGVGGVNKNFNITYAGLGGDGYVNNYYNDENPTTYTVTVTYSIVAQ